MKFNRNLGTLTISVRIAPETKKDSGGSLKQTGKMLLITNVADEGNGISPSA